MSTRVRAVRVVSATDEPEQLPMPAQGAELVEVEVLPAEPCTSHRQSPSLPRLPSRFCFPKSSASQCSVTNIYCHMPETRHIAAAGSGSQASLPGTRLDWKLQPDGRLEVRVGPALTEEEEAKQAKDKDATKKADIEEKKDGSPAAATPEAPAGASTSAQPSGGGGSKAASIKPDRTWSFKLGPRAPVSFEVTLGAKTALPTRQASAFSVRILDVPVAGPVGRVSPRRPSLPAYIVRRRSSVPDCVGEQEEPPPPLRPCVECVEELARRLADSGPCRINVVTRSASFSATESVARAVVHDSGILAGSELEDI